MGMDRSGLLQLPPFLRDVELVIMSLILVLMAGYLGRGGGCWKREWLGAEGILRPSFHPKNWATATKKKNKRGPCDLTWNTACLMPGFLFFHVFFFNNPQFFNCGRRSSPKKNPKQRDVFFFSMARLKILNSCKIHTVFWATKLEVFEKQIANYSGLHNTCLEAKTSLEVLVTTLEVWACFKNRLSVTHVI